MRTTNPFLLILFGAFFSFKASAALIQIHSYEKHPVYGNSFEIKDCSLSSGSVLTESALKTICNGSTLFENGKRKGPITQMYVNGYLRVSYRSSNNRIYQKDVGTYSRVDSCPDGQSLSEMGVCEAAPEKPDCSSTVDKIVSRTWDQSTMGSKPTYCYESCMYTVEKSVCADADGVFTCSGDVSGNGQSCDADGATPGGTFPNTGGDGGSGGDSGGSGGDSGGSGGDSGGSGGDSGFNDAGIISAIGKLDKSVKDMDGNLSSSITGLGTNIDGLGDKLDKLITGGDRSFTAPNIPSVDTSPLTDSVEGLQSDIELLKREVKAKLASSPVKLGQMNFNDGDYQGTKFTLSRDGWGVDVEFNLFGVLGASSSDIRNVILFAAALLAAFILLSGGREK